MVKTDYSRPFKAISVKQPWAWAIFHGKSFENRTWHSGSFRGPLLIHASQARDEFVHGELALKHHGVICPKFKELPAGALIGIVRHLGAWKIENLHRCPVNRDWYAEGPVCHVYQNQTLFGQPISYSGQRGLFDVPLEVVREALTNLPSHALVYFRGLYKEWCHQQYSQ